MSFELYASVTLRCLQVSLKPLYIRRVGIIQAPTVYRRPQRLKVLPATPIWQLLSKFCQWPTCWIVMDDIFDGIRYRRNAFEVVPPKKFWRSAAAKVLQNW